MRISPLELASLVHVEAVLAADKLAESAQEAKLNTVYDASLRNHDNALALIESFRESEYGSVEVLLAQVDMETATRRAYDRWLKERQAFDAGESVLGGRYVPRSLIASQYDKNGQPISLEVGRRLIALPATNAWPPERPRVERMTAVDTVSGKVLHDSDAPPQLPGSERTLARRTGTRHRARVTQQTSSPSRPPSVLPSTTGPGRGAASWRAPSRTQHNRFYS